MEHLHQIYDYCRAHIDHFDWRADMALAIMDVQRCSLEHANPLLFREMRDCAEEWMEENNIYVDYFDDINIEDVFLFGPQEG